MVAAIDAPGFALTDGNHWHLFVDDRLRLMSYQPEARLTLGQGARRLTAALSGPNHCEYGIEATTMLGVPATSADGGNGGGMAMSNGDSHSHSDGDGGAETTLGTLVVRPR